jgi:hypothetical protein
VHTTVVEVKAAGSVDDYDEMKKSSIAGKAAMEAGIEKRFVTVTLKPASLLIQISIITTTEAEANRVTQQLAARLSTASAAEMALGIEKVESVPSITQTFQSPLSQTLTPLNITLIAICAGSILLNLIFIQRWYYTSVLGYVEETRIAPTRERDGADDVEKSPKEDMKEPIGSSEPATLTPASSQKNGGANAAAIAAFAAASFRSVSDRAAGLSPRPPIALLSQKLSASSQEASPPLPIQVDTNAIAGSAARPPSRVGFQDVPSSPATRPGTRPATPPNFVSAKAIGGDEGVLTPNPVIAHSPHRHEESESRPRTPLPPILTQERIPAQTDLGKAFAALESRPLTPDTPGSRARPDRIETGGALVVVRPDPFQQFASSATRVVTARLSRAGSARRSRSRPNSASPAVRAATALEEAELAHLADASRGLFGSTINQQAMGSPRSDRQGAHPTARSSRPSSSGTSRYRVHDTSPRESGNDPKAAW